MKCNLAKGDRYLKDLNITPKEIESILNDELLEASLAQKSLRWILDHEQVSTVIPGATTVEQASQNAEVSKFASLSKEAHLKLNSLYIDKIDSNVRGRY